MTTFSEIAVERACCRLIDYRGKTPPKSASGVRLITAKVIKDGQILDEPAEFIATDFYDAWMRRGLPQQWDVLLTTEAPLGEVAMLRTGEKVALAQRVILLRADPQVMEQRYLFYALRSGLVQARLAARATGTTVLGIKQSELRQVLLPIPEIKTQRRISAILSAYDDLIEVNRRRIAVVEELARRLFEEWFVRLRTPGNELLVPEGQGGLPPGWFVGTAGDLIEFDPAMRWTAEGAKPFIPMTLLSTSTSLIDTPEWREGGSGPKFRNGDTLFARITPCLENGKTGLVRSLPNAGVGFGSTEFIVMRGKSAGPAFTYLLARHDAFRAHAEKGMSGASGRQRVRTERLRTFAFPVAPADVLRQFESLAWPMLEQAGCLGEANKRLAASRDLLLPRLISGEAEIPAAQRALEAIA